MGRPSLFVSDSASPMSNPFFPSGPSVTRRRLGGSDDELS